MSDLQVRTLPAAPMSDDLIDRIAKEVAAQVSTHIETMYPAAAEVVAWNSCKRSIQGVVRNNIAAASRATENGTIEIWLKTVRTARLKLLAMRRKNSTPILRRRSMTKGTVVTINQLRFWARAMADWEDGGESALCEIERLIEAAESDESNTHDEEKSGD